MANNHAHSPWRKSMLIPFWTIQLFFMLVFIALLGLALGVLVTYDNSNDEDWDDTRFNGISDPENVVHEAKDVVVPVWISLCVICLILTVTEIILLARHKLRPLAFLIMNVIKAAVWTALFVLDVISAVTASGRTTSVVGIIIDTILLLSFWIPLIYGSVIYHRFRREAKSYKPVDHPYADPHSTAYESQFPKAYVHSDLESANIPALPQQTGDRTRSVSFNHQRDTRYETYRLSSTSPIQPGMDSFDNRGLVETYETRGLIVDGRDVPQVYVEHHDGEVFEMESRRQLR